MKPLAWFNHAVRAVYVIHHFDAHLTDDIHRATEAIGISGDAVTQSELSKLQIGKNGVYILTSGPTSPAPLSRQPKTPPTLDLKSVCNPVLTCLWDESFEPESPPPLLKPSFDEAFAEDLINARTEFDVKPSRSSEQDSKYSSTDAIEHEAKDSTSAEPLREISATILRSSDSIPISIIVTPPFEEIPELVTSPPVRARNVANFPLVKLNFSHLADVNPSFLMPPTDNQLDPHKLRKAQEFRKIREWLINFLNSKGDRFPRKVRLRMMGLYCIRDFDLAPDIVAKFKAEMPDEGVSSGHQGEGVDDAQSLSILSAAFRSQIEEVIPRKDKVVSLPSPHSRQRQASLPKKVEIHKQVSLSFKDENRPAASTKLSATENIDMSLLPSHLGPMISTSASSSDSLLANPQYLKRAYSAPNLKSKTRLHSTDLMSSVPGFRPRGSTVSGDEAQIKQSGPKRGNFISEALGTMRYAMSRQSKKEIRKKKSWADR